MQDKWTPDVVMTIKGYSPVVETTAYPPHRHPPKTPIKKHLTLVQLKCRNGESRFYGFDSAYIDSHLRMRVSGIDARDEVLSKWEDARD